MTSGLESSLGASGPCPKWGASALLEGFSAGEVKLARRLRALRSTQPAVEAGAECNHLRGSNQYFDAETGLHQNWYRYYDPNTGRYITEDPLIREIPGFDQPAYAFVENNPLSITDLDGRCPVCAIVVGGGAIADAAAAALAALLVAMGMDAIDELVDAAANDDGRSVSNDDTDVDLTDITDGTDRDEWCALTHEPVTDDDSCVRACGYLCVESGARFVTNSEGACPVVTSRRILQASGRRVF